MLPNIRGKSLEDDCLTPDLLSQIPFSLEVEEIENPQYMDFISGSANFTRDSCSVGVEKGARSKQRNGELLKPSRDSQTTKVAFEESFELFPILFCLSE